MRIFTDKNKFLKIAKIVIIYINKQQPKKPPFAGYRVPEISGLLVLISKARITFRRRNKNENS